MLVFLWGEPEASLSFEVIEQFQAPLPEVDLTASPFSIMAGESSTLSWNSSHADSCVIEPDIGSVDLNGSMTLAPAETIAYTITATGTGGSAIDGVLVTVVDPAPSVNMWADKSGILIGESVTLTWTSENADSVFIEQDAVVGFTIPAAFCFQQGVPTGIVELYPSLVVLVHCIVDVPWVEDFVKLILDLPVNHVHTHRPSFFIANVICVCVVCVMVVSQHVD